MIQDPVVMLDNLVLSLSDALDLVHPFTVDHQQRVAYIALRLARAMEYGLLEQADLMYASVLHDIGFLTVEEKLDYMNPKHEDDRHHAELGANLLRRFDTFAVASEIVRLHHRPWSNEEGWENVNKNLRECSNIVCLADFVDRFVKKNTSILKQAEPVCKEISMMAGKAIAPHLVECFQELAQQESFWLDLVSPRIYSVLLNLIRWPRVELTIDSLNQIAMIFSRIVDYRSHFTATHSAGVATVAQELARKMYFSGKDCRLMLVAGYLHDLGKVAVPNSILEKPGKLDPREFDVIRAHTYYTDHILSTIGGFEEINKWASFHHERLNGKGYPFHLKGEDLPLGSRIMCVADVFTALTENRPYRKGTARAETVPLLQNLVKNGGLDWNVVKVMADNYEEIDQARAAIQEIYSNDYTSLLGGSSSSPGRP